MNTELLRNAIAGFNIIPTALLGLVILYWLIAIVGVFDFEVLDMDIEAGGDNTGPLSGIAVFLNIGGEVPFALVFSLLVLNFWVMAMLLYLLPFEAGGGVLNGILLIPTLVCSIYFTKVEILPLKKIIQKQ